MAEEKAERHVAARHATGDKGDTKPFRLNRTSMFHEGVEYGHGDEVHLDPKRGEQLAELGVVVPASDWDSHQADEGKVNEDRVKAEREAVEAAAEIEAIKVRSAEEQRAAYSEPPAVRRGRPARG